MSSTAYGPGGDYTPPTLGPPLIAVGSVQYDDMDSSQQQSADMTDSTLGSTAASGMEEDMYGTAFAPPPSPPLPTENLTSSGVQRIVDKQLEKYNVSIPGQAGQEGENSTASPTSKMPDVHSAGQQTARHVDLSLENAKIMLDEEEEAELFPEGESLLHGGGTKAVTYRDWTFATMFLANLAAVVVFFVIFQVLGRHQNSQQSKHRMLGRDVSVALYGSGMIALGFAFLWLGVLKVAAQILIKAAILFSLAVTFSVAVFSFAKGGIMSGIGLLLLVVLEAIYCKQVWARADLAAATIGVTVSFTSQYPAVFLVAAASLGVQLLWLLLWSTTSYNAMVYFGGNTTGQLLALYFILMLFWGVQVLKNLVHVTIAGSFASWYFRFPHHQETNPTLTALVRACTTSFGSVCLGSLVVAIVRTLRTFAHAAHQGSKNRNAVLATVFNRLLACTEHLAQYFNVYAFVQVAVYGRTYIEAAKKASDIVRSTGVDALVNDDLVGSVLTMGAAVGGLACGTIPARLGVASGALTYSQGWVTFIIGGLLGYTIIMAVMAVVWSSVVTLFVCFAEDPTALYHTKPAEYQRLVAAWRERSGGSVPIGVELPPDTVEDERGVHIGQHNMPMNV